LPEKELFFTVKKKRIVWEFKQNKRIIKNPKVLKAYVGCNLERTVTLVSIGISV